MASTIHCGCVGEIADSPALRITTACSMIITYTQSLVEAIRPSMDSVSSICSGSASCEPTKQIIVAFVATEVSARIFMTVFHAPMVSQRSQIGRR